MSGCGPGTLTGCSTIASSRPGSKSRRPRSPARAASTRASRSASSPSLRALPDDCRDYDVATDVEVVEHLAPADVDDVSPGDGRAPAPGREARRDYAELPLRVAARGVLGNRFGELEYTSQDINRCPPRLLRQLLEVLGLNDVRVHSFLALAPFTARFGWRLPDRLAHLERGPLDRVAGSCSSAPASSPGGSSNAATGPRRLRLREPSARSCRSHRARRSAVGGVSLAEAGGIPT